MSLSLSFGATLAAMALQYHLNILEHYQMNMFCDVSDLPNSTINWSADKLIFWDHSLNCAQGDRYRVIRHGSDLGFVALEDGRPMPRDQRDENPMSEGSEGEDLTTGFV